MWLFGKKDTVGGCLKNYSVTYLEENLDSPNRNNSKITLNIMLDCFYLRPTAGSQKWFKELKIPYGSISKFEITPQTASTVDLPNNIQITYTDDSGRKITLHLEMLTGITATGQAQKCNEMMDFIKVNGILEQFNMPSKKGPSANDIPSQIESLAKLKEQGILTKDEFNKKKTELLTKM
jgi:hypothetical protein